MLPRRHPSPDHLRGPALAACGVASVVLYVILFDVVPGLGSAEPTYAWQIFPWALPLDHASVVDARESLDLATRSALHTSAAIRFIAIVSALYVLYWLGFQIVGRTRSTRLEAASFVVGFALLAIQVASPAMLSTDVFSYISYGRILGIYNGDPYQDVPAQYQGDQFLELVYWKSVPSFYGPLWTLVSAWLALIGAEHVGLTVLLFRGLSALAGVGCGALLWACLRRAAPERAGQGLVFLLWNPVFVLESGLSGHNDSLMAALLLSAIWLHLWRRRALAVISLCESALVKFATAPIVPLYMLLALRNERSWRNRAGLLVGSVLGAAILSMGVLIAVRLGPEVLAVGALGSDAERYTNSLHELAFAGLRLGIGEDLDTVRTPLHFRGWWAATHTRAGLWSASGPSAELVGYLNPWTEVLVLAPQEGRWLRIYDPTGGRTGYLHVERMGPIDAPAWAASDPVVIQLLAGPPASPAAMQANLWIRTGSWLTLALVWVIAALQTTNLRSYVVWSAIVLLTFYGLVATWVWPWYLVWPLVLAALIPGSTVALLTAIFSAASLSLYATTGYQGAEWWWLFNLRSLPAFVLPLVVFGAIRLLTWMLDARVPPRPGDSPRTHRRSQQSPQGE